MLSCDRCKNSEVRVVKVLISFSYDIIIDGRTIKNPLPDIMYLDLCESCQTSIKSFIRAKVLEYKKQRMFKILICWMETAWNYIRYGFIVSGHTFEEKDDFLECSRCRYKTNKE